MLSNLWKFTFPEPEHEKKIQELLMEYTKGRNAVARYMSEPSHKRVLRYAKELKQREMEARFDFYASFIDHQHRIIIRKLLVYSKEHDYDQHDVMRSFYVVYDAYYWKRDKRIVDEPFMIHWMECLQSQSEMADVQRDNIRTMKSFSHDLAKKCGSSCMDEVLDFLLEELSDTELFSMISGCIDEELAGLIETQCDVEPACSDYVLNNRAEAVRNAKALFDKYHDEEEALHSKLAKTYGYTVQIMGNLPLKYFDSENMFVISLMAAWEVEAIKALQLHRRWNPTPNFFNDHSDKIPCDPIFWHLALQMLLRQPGMISGDNLDERALQMVIDAMHRPKKFHKNKCSPRLVKLKSKLKSTLAAFVSTPVRSSRTETAQSSMEPTESSQRLSMLATELACLQQQRLGDGVELTGTQLSAIKDIYGLLHTRSHQDMLDALSMTYLKDAMENLQDSESVEVGADELAEKSELDTDEELVIPEYDDHENLITCRYVKNPDSGLAKFKEFDLKDENDMNVLLQKEKVGITIKPMSALNAIRYFRTMPDSIKHTWMKDEINGLRWNKLKRADTRIRIHEEDGHLYLNIIPRKDWKQST